MNRFIRRHAARGSIRLHDLAAVLCSGFVLAIALQQVQVEGYAKSSRNRNQCHWNLRDISIAMQVYANDYRFFPHMSAADTEDTAADASTAFRTLLYFQYLENPDNIICPESEEYSAKMADVVLEDARRFKWDQGSAPYPQKAPLFNKEADPHIDLNENLSYGHRRKRLAIGEASSKAMLSSDKAIQDPNCDTFSRG
jgi:hypothetical protein